MLTFNDLKNYDLKNVDVNKLSKSIVQRKDVLACLGIIAVAFIVLFNMMSSYRSKIGTLNTKIKTMEKKSKVLDECTNAKKELESLVSSLPKGLSKSDEIVAKINNYAIARNILVQSFSPSGNMEGEFYTQTTIQISLLAPSYSELGNFIQEIEHSPYNIRVDRWMGENIQNSNEQIKAEIDVSSIAFKNENK